MPHPRRRAAKAVSDSRALWNGPKKWVVAREYTRMKSSGPLALVARAAKDELLQTQTAAKAAEEAAEEAEEAPPPRRGRRASTRSCEAGITLEELHAQAQAPR